MQASGEHNIILFNEFKNLVMNLHEFNVLFITYPEKNSYL